MKITWKDSLRQAITHFFDERKDIGYIGFEFTLKAVREDSGSTFHDGCNSGINYIMLDVMIRNNANARAG